MGFSTIYLRAFSFDRPLSEEHAELLIEINQTEFDDAEYNVGEEGGPPNMYCQWVPTEDRLGLEWDKIEKFYDAEKWLTYLIDNYIQPWGYKLNGESPWYIDDFQQAGILRVVDNVVIQEPREIDDIKKEYGELDLY